MLTSILLGSPTGKGMHSKIYTSLLNQHSWLHNCTAINSMYNETGLFGVFTSAESQYASKAVDAVCGVLQVCRVRLQLRVCTPHSLAFDWHHAAEDLCAAKGGRCSLRSAARQLCCASVLASVHIVASLPLEPMDAVGGVLQVRQVLLTFAEQLTQKHCKGCGCSLCAGPRRLECWSSQCALSHK